MCCTFLCGMCSDITFSAKEIRTFRTVQCGRLLIAKGAKTAKFIRSLVDVEGGLRLLPLFVLLFRRHCSRPTMCTRVSVGAFQCSCKCSLFCKGCGGSCRVFASPGWTSLSNFHSNSFIYTSSCRVATVWQLRVPLWSQEALVAPVEIKSSQKQPTWQTSKTGKPINRV